MTRSRVGWLIALSVVVGAFLVRLLFIMQTRGLPAYYHPIGEAGFLQQWAAFKKTVTWFDVSPAFREPLYAYFLASIYSVLRDSLTAARIVQAILDSASALMVYSMARTAFGRLAGAVAGIVFALSTQAIFFSGEISETTLVVFLVIASAYLLARATVARPYLNSGLSGIAMGAAYLSRLASVAAVPAWIAYLLWRKEAKLRRAAVVFVAGCLVAPIAYQALLVKGNEHTIIPPRASWQAFLGSGSVGGTIKQTRFDVPIVTGEGAYRAIVAPDWTEGEKDEIRLARIESGRPVSVGTASAHWRSRAFRDLMSRPGRFLRTYFTKLGILWGPSEPPVNASTRYAAGGSPLMKNVLFAFAVIAPVGLVGCLRRGSALAHLALLLPAYSVVSSIYLVSDSDKMVLVPALAIFAGAFARDLVAQFRKPRGGRAAAFVVTAVVAGVLLYLLPHAGADRVQGLVAQGNIYREESVLDKAEANYREAIKLAPEEPEAYIGLAEVYRSTWKPDLALGALDSAVGLAAQNPRLIIERASVLLAGGKLDQALAVARPLEASYPFEPGLHEVIAVALIDKGDPEVAIGELRQELDYGNGGFITYLALGRANMNLEKYSEAAGYLEQAVKLNPNNAQAVLELAGAYDKMGQYLKACNVLGRVLSVDPGNLQLRFKLANSLYWAGRYADALKQFKDLSAFEPKNADIAVNMGTVYAAMDSTVRAIEMWEKALALDPTNQTAKDNLKEARTPK